MFAKVLRIQSTPALQIMPMETREELAKRPLRLNGRRAVLMGLEDAQATIMDPKTGLCQPWPWDATLERMIRSGGNAITLNGWRTTSYFI